ncbi:MAG: T9SS type A sorting domain-containing protein [Bacteroidales bacterium]|nr:T9SS type A sorting domain-containing protein [Bacteroidales bacterium]
MKRLLVSIALLAGIVAAHADSYNYLNLTSSSSIQSVALTSVKKITFENGNAVVTTTDGTTLSAALSTLTSLTFTDTATGVREVNGGKSLQLQSGRIVANGSGWLRVYNTNGQLVRQQQVSSTRAELNLDGLPHGLYIAKLGSQTLKVLH